MPFRESDAPWWGEDGPSPVIPSPSRDLGRWRQLACSWFDKRRTEASHASASSHLAPRRPRTGNGLATNGGTLITKCEPFRSS